MNHDAPNVTVAIRQIGDADSTPVDFGDRLVSFAYDDNAKLVDEATLVLDNWDLAFFDDPLFRLKNEVDVSWGYHGDMSAVRRCVIVEISGGQLLTIKAHGQAVWMDGERKTRTWTNVTRSDVVRKIAEEHGFGTDAYVEDTEVIYPQITQARCTDAQFIQHLADQEGFEFNIGSGGGAGGGKKKATSRASSGASTKGAAHGKTVARGELFFHAPNFEQTPIKTLVWAGKTNAEDPDCVFVTFPTITEEVKGKVGAMSQKGIDPVAKKKIAVTSSNENHTEPTLGTTIETFDQRSCQSLGISTKAASEATSPTSAPTEAAATREAKAKYRKSRTTLLKMKCTIIGDKNVGARDMIEVRGIGQRFSGNWYIQKANHRPVGGGPYVTALECTRDAHFGWADPKRDVKAKGALNKKDAPDDAEKNQDLDAVELFDQKTGASKGTSYQPRH